MKKISKAKLALAIATGAALMKLVKIFFCRCIYQMPMFGKMFHRCPEHQFTILKGKRFPVIPHACPYSYIITKVICIFIITYVGVLFILWFYEKLTTE